MQARQSRQGEGEHESESEAKAIRGREEAKGENKINSQ